MTTSSHSKTLVTVPIARVESAILFVRGERVILASDLARLYGVSTKRLNEQVRRNSGRFPADFMFQLTGPEKAEVVANCDHLRRLKFSATLPYAFTEYGTIMAANVLNSEQAVRASVQVVRAFIQLRGLLASNVELSGKVSELEKKYDRQFKIVFEAIRQLMVPAPEKSKPIGFRPKALNR
jgi:hypothetical protein